MRTCRLCGRSGFRSTFLHPRFRHYVCADVAACSSRAETDRPVLSQRPGARERWRLRWWWWVHIKGADLMPPTEDLPLFLGLPIVLGVVVFIALRLAG